MKGVILSINPDGRVVDLTHGIPAGDIRAGAFALMAGYKFFPAGTIHVAVIDPGVGSARAAIVVETHQYIFIGPDNGVLSFTLKNETIRTVRRIENHALFAGPLSRTFHGRDLFAPVAAHLSTGVPLGKVGPKVSSFVELDFPSVAIRENGMSGEVIYIDAFGNALTNIPESLRRDIPALLHNLTVMLPSRRMVPVRDCYQSVPKGKAVAVFGSTGFLEIAVNGGTAARSLRLKIGSRIWIRSNE
jgi:S-adenosyl-L-methionine hydrolase (adenosine-forming)